MALTLFDANTTFTVGAGIATAAGGKITGVALGTTGQDGVDQVIGTVLGTGERVSNTTLQINLLVSCYRQTRYN